MPNLGALCQFLLSHDNIPNYIQIPQTLPFENAQTTNNLYRFEWFSLDLSTYFAFHPKYGFGRFSEQSLRAYSSRQLEFSEETSRAGSSMVMEDPSESRMSPAQTGVHVFAGRMLSEENFICHLFTSGKWCDYYKTIRTP